MAWLKKIAQNRNRDFWLSKGKEMIPLAQSRIPTLQMEPKRLVLRQELIDTIVEAVELFPSEDREVVRAYREFALRVIPLKPKLYESCLEDAL